MLRVLILVSLLLPSCISFPRADLEPTPPPAEPRDVPVWIVGGSLHSDFIVETKWLMESGCKLPHTLRDYRYVCFGWGDRIAYTHRWGLDDVPAALFWPTDSIVQVVGFNTEVDPTFPQLRVTQSQVPAHKGRDLANFLNHSFSFESSESPTPITTREAKWGYGYFIQSPYRYYAPRMCNQWVATALKEAGVETVSATPWNSSRSLRRAVERYNKKLK